MRLHPTPAHAGLTEVLSVHPNLCLWGSRFRPPPLLHLIPSRLRSQVPKSGAFPSRRPHCDETMRTTACFYLSCRCPFLMSTPGGLVFMIFLKQASHLSSNDIWGRHRRELSSVPAPPCLEHPPPPSCDNQQCRQTLPSGPQGAKGRTEFPALKDKKGGKEEGGAGAEAVGLGLHPVGVKGHWSQIKLRCPHLTLPDLSLFTCKMGHSTKSQAWHTVGAHKCWPYIHKHWSSVGCLLSCRAPKAYSWGPRLPVRKTRLPPGNSVMHGAVWGLTRLPAGHPHGAWSLRRAAPWRLRAPLRPARLGWTPRGSRGSCRPGAHTLK